MHISDWWKEARARYSTGRKHKPDLLNFLWSAHLAGKVYLIGAGPGDPGLITVAGLRLLQQADVIVYDRLVDDRLLGHTKKGSEMVFAGKGPGNRTMEQEEINRCLIEKAREGKAVVRLKGGDPFVFGRGGEEAQALRQADIPFEVVPGVTSAIAAPAYAGIPLTHREIATSFTVVSGSENPAKQDSSVNWKALAKTGGTLVVLMGWNALDDIVRALADDGMDASTPVALIRWGTEAYQQTVTGILEDIVERGREAGLSPPIVAVFGPVVNLREELRWFDNRPLFGKRVLVTRSRTQVSTLSELLAREGALPIGIPAIEISAVDDYSTIDRAISSPQSYDWIIFTSANGVDAIFSRMATLGLDSRALGGVKVGAIGPATAAALELRGINPDRVPGEFVSEAMVEALSDVDLNKARVLLPRSEIARDELATGLARLGALVEDLPVYRTVTPQESRAKALKALNDGTIDIVTFTSSSTVANLVDMLDGNAGLLDDLTIACIGPITTNKAKDLGLNVDIMAREYTTAGLVQAMKDYFTSVEVR